MSRKETWTPITRYVGLYEISNNGKTKSLAKKVVCGYYKNGSIAYANKVEKILKPALTIYGYHYVVLNKKGIAKNKMVHRLVAQAFIPNPQKKRTVNHKNGIKTDNRVENLEWNTHKENHRHAFDVLGRKGTRAGKFGKNNPDSKRVIQMSLSGKFVKAWDSMADAERIGKFNNSSISNCCNNKKLKTHAGFKWKFAKQVKKK